MLYQLYDADVEGFSGAAEEGASLAAESEPEEPQAEKAASSAKARTREISFKVFFFMVQSSLLKRLSF